MGWAKYFEDNVSIYNNRMALIESDVTAHQICRGAGVYLTDWNKRRAETDGVKKPRDKCRFGIMIVFYADVEKSAARKLQMNGWWFSKANSCWCNYNNPINRQYAQRLATDQTVKVFFAA